jgi:RND family efflux transporter MFP subunit
VSPAEGSVSTQIAPATGRILAIASIALIVVLVLGFGVGLALHEQSERRAEATAGEAMQAAPAVDVVNVAPTPASYPLALPGQTAGWYQSTIFARIDGYIQSWSADIGDRVKQGQVLATIDTPELDQQLNAARAKVAASQAQVQVAQSDVSIAKVTYDRWWNSPKGVVSDQEREEKRATYESAQAHLAGAVAQARLDAAGVSRLEALEAFKQVTAPYDGVITARHVDLGDLVTAGSGSNTSSLYGIAQSKMIRVFVDVPQKAAADLIVGLPAEATADQFPGRIFHGSVARYAMSIDAQTRTERTEVDIPNPDLTLLPGMYVHVTFKLKGSGQVQVPAAAILFRPSGLQVAVIGGDNKVEFRDITVAKDNGDMVELASGVGIGERVALNISSAIAPGEQVQPVEVAADIPAPPPTTQSASQSATESTAAAGS